LPWPECDQPTLRAALEAEVDAATEELHAELAAQTPGYEKMRARLKRTLAVLLEADRRRACVGSLRPAAVELTFGNSSPAPSAALDSDLDPDAAGNAGSGKSEWFNLKFNKGDGTPAKTSDLFSHDDFQLILDYTHWKIAALADDLTQGKIAPVPYRSRAEA